MRFDLNVYMLSRNGWMWVECHRTEYWDTGLSHKSTTWHYAKKKIIIIQFYSNRESCCALLVRCRCWFSPGFAAKVMAAALFLFLRSRRMVKKDFSCISESLKELYFLIRPRLKLKQLKHGKKNIREDWYTRFENKYCGYFGFQCTR